MCHARLCNPAASGMRPHNEIPAEVIDGPRSLVAEQATNRHPTEQAVLNSLATGGR
jgi:ornithine carbamoyltransferase